MAIMVEDLTGQDMERAIDGLAALRIKVFHDWPYLYDGDPDYEAEYLRAYTESGGAIIVAAWDGDRMVGAATGAPMEDHAEDFGAPLEARGFALEDVFYCGESVLLPEYRGRGLGHAFFDRREAQARRLGRRYCCFCSVIRPTDHPLKPHDYRPLDTFWRRRGYVPLDGVTAAFTWKDVGASEETEKQMTVWLRSLD